MNPRRLTAPALQVETLDNLADDPAPLLLKQESSDDEAVDIAA